MTTLVLVLTAGLTLADGPAKMPGDVQQDLRLDGEWQGYLYCTPYDPIEIRIGFEGGKFGHGSVIVLEGKIQDEGEGRFRMSGGLFDLLGIYRHEDHRLTLCYRDAENGRPTSFRTHDAQYLLVLERITVPRE